MLLALCSRDQVPNALNKGLPPLRAGPAEQLLGFLPRQLKAVQGRADRLATAQQPEALAHPARPGGAASSAAPDRLQLRAASWPHAGRIGSARPVRPCDVATRASPAPGAPK